MIVEMLERLGSALTDVERKLIEKMEKRDELIKKGRDILSICSKAVVLVHTARADEARKELSKARNLLISIKENTDQSLQRYVIPSEQEYVEAEIVLALATGKDVPLPSELECSAESYILGLLDTIGELKRLSLSCIMSGDLKGSERYFTAMEKIYSLCSPFAVYDNVLPGTRRKIDVARMLVEDMRGIIAEEKSRRRLKSSVERLGRKLSNRG
jgi:translin